MILTCFNFNRIDFISGEFTRFKKKVKYIRIVYNRLQENRLKFTQAFFIFKNLNLGFSRID